jgi:hypothetical protein
MKLSMNAPRLVHASDGKAGQVTARPKKKQNKKTKKNKKTRLCELRDRRVPYMSQYPEDCEAVDANSHMPTR